MKFMNTFLMKVGATVAGALYVTICMRVENFEYSHCPGAIAGILYYALVIGVLVLAVSALANSFEWGSKISVPFFLIGTAVAVARDALTDTKMDRNLFPIEIAFWCAIFAVAMGLGKELGAWWKKKHQKSSYAELRQFKR
jgi:hypothetical protein